MKVEVEASELARTLEIAARGTAGSTIPILQALRLEAGGGKLAVCGTNMDVAVFARAACTPVGGKGGARVAVCGPASQLVKAAKTLSGQVTVETDEKEGKLALVAGRTRLTFDLLTTADFPKVEDGGEPLFSVPTATLARLFASVSRSYSRDTSRPVLTAVKIEHASPVTAKKGRLDGHLLFAATDSYRLAVDSVPSELEDATLAEAVPGDSLALALKLFGKAERVQLVGGDGYVETGGDGTRRYRKLGFQADGVSVWARTIDGTFPDWRQLIPDYADGGSTVSFKRADAIAAVKRIKTLAQGKTPMRVEVSAGAPMRLALHQYDGVDVSDEIDADAQVNGRLEIGLNAPFLLEALEALPGEHTSMAVVSPLRPVVFRNGSELPLHLLMPIRLAS